jgi:hypothetical protein
VRNDAGKAPGTGGKDDKGGRPPCHCPFCESPVEASLPFCTACGREVRRCSTCGKVLAADEKVCPNCK